DFVIGKRKGFIILLHGLLGVGKTLIVKVVSKRLKKLFYSISTKELPLDTTKLEVRLSRIFKTTSYWNTILFLDEADVFLKQRSADNLTCNSLVFIFLRKLEYYKRVMFLTTNQVAWFDNVIFNRTYLILRYDILNKNARKQV
ncbi:P-loop containing nucleoside triphosphate hydrolase protein, partial [Cadophora sp. DSE1049]